MHEGKQLRTSILALAWTALVAVFALGTPGIVAAQGTATIRGTVADASGGVLPGATVTITNSGTRDMRTAVTDDRGGYTFASLFNGTYEIKVELEGFKGSSIMLVVPERDLTPAHREMTEALVADLTTQLVGGIGRETLRIHRAVNDADRLRRDAEELLEMALNHPAIDDHEGPGQHATPTYRNDRSARNDRQPATAVNPTQVGISCS